MGNRIKLVVSEEDVRKAYQRAMDSMARLNRTASRLMHKYNAHAATDITGFDFLGTPRLLLVTRRLRLALLSTTCLLSPRWQQWGRLVATCSSLLRVTLLRLQEVSSSAFQESKLRPTARTFRRWRAIRLGSLALLRKATGQRGSLTSPG